MFDVKENMFLTMFALLFGARGPFIMRRSDFVSYSAGLTCFNIMSRVTKVGPSPRSNMVEHFHNLVLEAAPGSACSILPTQALQELQRARHGERSDARGPFLVLKNRMWTV